MSNETDEPKVTYINSDSDVTDDHMRNELGMTERQIKEFREKQEARKQKNVEGTMNDQQKRINDQDGSTSTDKNIMDLLMKLRENGELEKYLRLLKASNDDAGGASAALCGQCMTTVGDGICCEICSEWFHFETMC